VIRRRKNVIAEFSHLPAAPSFSDVSAIGRLVVDEFLQGNADRVFLVYTDFVNMVKQIPDIKQLLPLEIGAGEGRVEKFEHAKSSVHISMSPGRSIDELFQDLPPFKYITIIIFVIACSPYGSNEKCDG
jgi:F-type H+-transporting ATPase subunit gamma